MNIYIATKFDNYKEALILKRRLEPKHKVTSRWINVALTLEGNCTAIPIGSVTRYENAEMDLKDIELSDCLIALVPKEGGTGMWLEIGYALALSKRVILVGKYAKERTVFAELCECYLDGLDDTRIAII